MELSKLKEMIKLRLILLSLVILQSCNRKLTVINYVIPEGFEGNVAIIYSKNNSAKLASYYFNIPEDGFLWVPHKFYRGDYLLNYYQKNKNNAYDTLFQELPTNKADTMKNRIYFARILTFEKKGTEPIIVETFYVGKKRASELVKDRFFFENKIEEIVLGKK